MSWAWDFVWVSGEVRTTCLWDLKRWGLGLPFVDAHQERA